MSQNCQQSPDEEGHQQSQEEEGIPNFDGRVDSGFMHRDDVHKPRKDKEPIQNKKSPEPRRFYLGTTSSSEDGSARHSGAASRYSCETMNLEQLFHFGEFHIPEESLSPLSMRGSGSGSGEFSCLSFSILP